MKDFLIELDVCLNEGEELRELSELMEEYDVEVYDINPEGPAGGHPCITFQGPEENLLKLGAYLLDDDDEGFIRESMRPKEK
jgi:hypothetical protein